MPDRQRTRRKPVEADSVAGAVEGTDRSYSAYNVEDIIPAEILNDTRVDREYLEQVFREPQKFLPPRERRAGHAAESEAEDLEQPPQPRESTLARRAKLVGLLAAGALVIGSVIAASTLTGPHRAQVAADAEEHGITGAAALGGFAVPDAAPNQHRSAKTTPAAKKPAAQQAPETQPEPGETTAAPSSTTASDTPRVETPPTTAKKLATVKTFYATVDSNPQGALALLDPLLAGEQPGDLVRAWSSMTSIQLQQVEVQADGSIKAVVLMLQPDGSHLLVTQLLKIADGSTNLISEAKLLSSQQM